MGIRDDVLNVWNGFFGLTPLRVRIIDLENIIKNQNDVLYQVGNEKVNLAMDKIRLQNKVESLTEAASVYQNTIVSLNNSIDSLKAELAYQTTEPETEKPKYISKDGFCYAWMFQSEGEDILLKNPTHVYTRSDMLYDLVKVEELKKLPRYQRLMKAWEFVIKAITYKYDKFDNAQLHVVSLYRKKGDCEDGAIMFLDILRMLGFSPTEVYNVVGNTSFGYHSYPVVWLTKEDIAGTPVESQGEGLYIYETTLDFLPDSPKKLNGSNYWCEGGIQNWRYFGAIDLNYSKNFNGVAMPKSGGSNVDIRKRRIDHGRQKRDEINEDWKSSKR